MMMMNTLMMLMLTDVDECTAGWHQCPATATCQNVVGQYLCHCGYGFYGDRKTCHRQLHSSLSLGGIAASAD